MKHSKAIKVLEAMEEGAPFGPDDVAAALAELRRATPLASKTAQGDTSLRARLQALVDAGHMITAGDLIELLDETA